MRKLSDVRVTNGIVHVVAPKRSQLILSEVELTLDEAIQNFLAGHVESGLHDSQAIAAKFIVEDSKRISGLSSNLLKSHDKLIDVSKRFAQKLNDVSEKDGRISDGTLVVLLCRGRMNSDAIDFLSLLKLDPSDAFRPVRTKVDGKQMVKLELEPDILPSARERLLKGAFIVADSALFGYRILAVDRQTAAEPARFFVSDFLGAEPFMDAKLRTTTLFNSLVRAQNEVAQDLSAKQLVALEKAIDGAMAVTEVNLDTLIPSLPVPNPIKSRIDEKISELLPDREFELDPGLARRFIDRIHYEADNDLRLSVPAEFFSQMVNVEDIKGTDPPRRRITIETQKWQKK